MGETMRFNPEGARAEIKKEQVVLKEGDFVLVERSPKNYGDGNIDPAYLDDGWKIERIQKFDPETGKPFIEGRAVVIKPDPEKKGSKLVKKIMMDDLKEMQATKRTLGEWVNFLGRMGGDAGMYSLENKDLNVELTAEEVKKILGEFREKLAVGKGRRTASESFRLLFPKN